MSDASTPPLDAAEVLIGLTAPEKHLSPKYFYDRRGSLLFDQICTLEEYYPTRTERALMREHADDIADLAGRHTTVIEFGAGSSDKIRLLLDHLHEPSAYVPIDISADYLRREAADLSRDYPDLAVRPVFADFTQSFPLPEQERALVFFPGSTIGNFCEPEALELLETMARAARPGGALLIGVDLRKDPARLEAAYNDSLGVTSAFNLNALGHLNRGLGADFDLGGFRHCAIYDEPRGRIEMRLISTRRQTATLAVVEVPFEDGEHIVTEYSHKYSIAGFHELAQRAGFEPVRTWVDKESLFSVHYLTAL